MTTAARPTARISKDGKMIVLLGYSPDLVAFYHTLPEARWRRVEKCWTCLLTPAAAARVAAEGIRLDETLTEIAGRYIALCNTARANAERAAEAGKQPEERHTDAWRHQRAAYWFAKQWGE